MTRRYLQLVLACLVHAFLFVGANWLGQWALILLSLLSALFIYCFIRLCLDLPYEKWWLPLAGQFSMIFLVTYLPFNGIQILALIYGFLMLYWIMDQPDMKRFVPYFLVILFPLVFVGKENIVDVILVSGNPWINVLSLPLARLTFTGSTLWAIYDCLIYFIMSALWTILFCLGLRWVKQRWN